MRTCLQVHGEWLLTPERVGIHLPTGTAVAADLHLGYDQARIRAGDAVPTVPLEEQLAPLRQIILHHGIRRLAVAGDLVEDARCGEVVPRLLEWLANAQVELVGIVPGNHDEGMRLNGAPLLAKGLSLGVWHVVHGDKRLPAGNVVQGHIHPMLRWSRHVAGPCYLVGSDRLILPAFSPDAAGIDVANDSRWRECRCCVIAGESVLDLGELRELATGGKPRASGRRGVRAYPRPTAFEVQCVKAPGATGSARPQSR
jgi:putative SbcD/Mre11-related phosphoesterase